MNLVIKSAGGDYPVEFVRTTAEIALTGPSQFVVTDSKIEKLHRLEIDIPAIAIDAGESTKDFNSVSSVCSWLQEAGATKHSTVVAIGGGVIQDVATMAAHLYHRGIKLVLVPTTLLAQADSCVGSKCGINLGGAKNQLGCFKSPTRVIVCPEFLTTLDDEAIRSGYGEILKLALVRGPDRFTDLETFVYNAGLRRSAASSVVASLVVKQRFIEEDEFETGQRIWLSYGHTFGHALEAVTDNAVPHGLAVAWGINVANWITVKLGVLSRDWRTRVKGFIDKYLAPQVPEVNASDLIAAIRRDKKSYDRVVKMVLMTEPGKMVQWSVPFDVLGEMIERYLRE